MFALLKNLFGKKSTAAPALFSTPAPHPDAQVPLASVEVVHLSLAAITQSLPEELHGILQAVPDESATVALPLQTIIKQLPLGCVKMSLASLHRQAVAGVFHPLPPGEKRMIHVPLDEVFRLISPSHYARRQDQFPFQPPDSRFNLFGNDGDYRAMSAPPEEFYEEQVVDLDADFPSDEMPEPAPAPRPAIYDGPEREKQRVLAPPPDFMSSFSARPKAVAPAAPPPASAAAPARPPSKLPPLKLPLSQISGAWPEAIRTELDGLNGSATLSLPGDAVSAGLAKGKVTFTWAELRSWIEPALEAPTEADGAAVLSLPLKVVAPLFLQSSRKLKAEPAPVPLDDSIPALFHSAVVPEVASTPVAPEPPAAEAPAEAAELTLEPQPLEVVAESISAGAGEIAPSLDSPEPVAEPTFEVFIPAAEPVPEAPETAPQTEEREPVGEAIAEEHDSWPATPAASPTGSGLGAIFQRPGKEDWTPAEIVAELPNLPGVAGGVVALQEGLLVAHSLPADIKGEVVAAFLPQIFARLNQYSGEMRLGEVDDLMFTTNGAHCQIYRLGYVYFAVLGKAGESLPWTELQTIAAELIRQTQNHN